MGLPSDESANKKYFEVFESGTLRYCYNGTSYIDIDVANGGIWNNKVTANKWQYYTIEIEPNGDYYDTLNLTVRLPILLTIQRAITFRLTAEASAISLQITAVRYALLPLSAYTTGPLQRALLTRYLSIPQR